MANFDVQIQALAGTATQSEMDQWMNDGVKEITNMLPMRLKRKCGTFTLLNDALTVLDTDSPDAPHVGEILHVTRENADSGYYVPCREIPAEYGDLANDSSSMHYATVTDPVWWIESKSDDEATLFVKPTPTAAQNAKVYHLGYTACDASEIAAISNFPNEAEYLVVLYAAIKVLQNKMNEKEGDLPSDIPEPTLDVISTSLPSDLILPTAPSVPTVSSNSVILPSSVPTYTKPNVSLDFGDADNWIKIEEDNEMLQARTTMIGSQINSYNADITNELNNFNKENAEYQAELQKAVKDTELLDANDTKKLQLFQTEVQLYQANVAKEVQGFSSVLQKYAAEISKVTESNQSKLNKYTQDMANHQSKLQKHAADYEWLQSQYAQLKQDYNQGIQMLIGGGPPQQGQKQEGEK